MNPGLKTTRYDQFFGQLDAKTFARLQRDLQSAPADSTTAATSVETLRNLGQLLEDGRFSAVLANTDEQFARWCLSPRFHYLRGQAAMQLGDQDATEEASILSQECLYWLCESGDGTFESPYKITYLTDEADILLAFGLEKRYQEIVEGPDGRLDVVTLHDGIEIWFDIANAI